MDDPGVRGGADRPEAPEEPFLERDHGVAAEKAVHLAFTHMQAFGEVEGLGRHAEAFGRIGGKQQGMPCVAM